MTARTESSVRERFCSVFSAAQGEDPGGTATWWRRLLAVEVAEPWASDVIRSRHFPSAVSQALDTAAQSGQQTKLQCVTPDAEYSTDGFSRAVLFSRPEGPFAAYAKEDYLVPDDQIGPLVEALLTQRDRLEAFETYRQDTGHLRDIFVCTHGSHDACCGSVGYPIYDTLRHRYAKEPGANLRVWRVSHLGGHRFAPNLLDLPEGRNWVRVGRDKLETLVYRNGPASDLRQSYRGWAGMESPFEQVLEREVLMREGWGWTDRLVSSELVEVDGQRERAEVRIDYSDLSGMAAGVYKGTVERTGSVLGVDCLTGEQAKETPQYTVTHLSQTG